MSPAKEILAQCEEKMKKTITDARTEMNNIRTGKPNPMLLDKINVDYYGTPTPLRQIANVSSPDGQSLVIQPFDRTALTNIEKAILKSDLGLTPNNDAVVIRINFPPLTEERRKELVKQVKKNGEENKVAIRNVRRDATEAIKKLKKSDNLPEDEVKAKTDDIQKLTDKYIEQIERVVAEKEKEVLAV
jgi:ribosome recycling factor